MIWATWILALASLVTAVANTVMIFTHGSADNARFDAHAERLDAHAERLDTLENGGSRM